MKPNPGSKEAIDLGCSCPVIDNHYGKGILIEENQEFWISQDCIVHDGGKSEKHQQKHEQRENY